MPKVSKVSEIAVHIQNRDKYYPGIQAMYISVRMENFRAEIEGVRCRSIKVLDIDNLEDLAKLRLLIITLLFSRNIFTTSDQDGNKIDWRVRYVKGLLPEHLMAEIDKTVYDAPLRRVHFLSELNQTRSYRKRLALARAVSKTNAAAA
jgi:hypothetical protein